MIKEFPKPENINTDAEIGSQVPEGSDNGLAQISHEELLKALHEQAKSIEVRNVRFQTTVKVGEFGYPRLVTSVQCENEAGQPIAAWEMDQPSCLEFVAKILQSIADAEPVASED